MRPRNPDDAPSILLDPSKTERDFDWAARTPLEDGVAKAVDYYREHGVERDVHAPEAARRVRPTRSVNDAGCSSSAAPASSARTSSGGSRGGARRRARRRQPALGGAGEPARRRRASSSSRRSIADDDVLARARRRLRLRLPPRDLPRQPELDREPARGSREQPDHDAQALRAAEGLRGGCASVVYSASGCTLAPHEVYDERRGDAGGRARAARPRQPVPDLEGRGRVLLRLLPPAARACRPCARASRTCTARARSSAPAAGAARRQHVWRNVTPTFVYRALKGLPLPLDGGGVASRDFVYVEDVVARPARCARRAARPATSTTSRAASRPRSASSPSSIIELAGSDAPSRVRAAAAVGPLDQALRQHGEGASASSASRRRSSSRTGSSARSTGRGRTSS